MRHPVENSGPVISVKGLSRLGWSPSDNGQIRPAMTTCWQQKVTNGPMSKYSERSQSVKIRGEKAGRNTQCNDILQWCGWCETQVQPTFRSNAKAHCNPKRCKHGRSILIPQWLMRLISADRDTILIIKLHLGLTIDITKNAPKRYFVVGAISVNWPEWYVTSGIQLRRSNQAVCPSSGCDAINLGLV